MHSRRLFAHSGVWVVVLKHSFAALVLVVMEGADAEIHVCVNGKGDADGVGLVHIEDNALARHAIHGVFFALELNYVFRPNVLLGTTKGFKKLGVVREGAATQPISARPPDLGAFVIVTRLLAVLLREMGSGL